LTVDRGEAALLDRLSVCVERFLISPLSAGRYSIGANIAEGCERVHAPDRRRFYAVARGSLYETEHWIMTAEARGLPGRDSRSD